MKKIEDLSHNIVFSLKLCWKNSRYRFCIILGLKIVMGFISTLMLVIWKNFIDSATKALEGDSNYIKICICFILLYCIVFIVRDTANRIVDYYSKWEADYLNKYITELCLKKVEGMTARELDEAETFNLISKANEQSADRIFNILNYTFLFLQNMVTLLSTATILFGLSFIPVALSIISTIPSFWVSVKIIEMYYDIYNKRFEKYRFISHLKHLILNSEYAKEIKIYGSGRYFRKYICTTYDDFIEEDSKLRRENAQKTTLAQTIDFVFLYTSKIYIIFLVLKRKLTIGALTMYVSGIEQFVGVLTTLLEIVKELYNNNLYMNSLDELEEMVGGKTKDQEREDLTHIDNIMFEHVSFKYGNQSEDVLSDITFEFKQGKKYCIVGENGSGKSTLLKLLTCLYEPESGKISINGKDASSYTKDSIYSCLNVMFQNFIHYPFTVAENIAMGQVDDMGNTEKVKKVSEIVASKDFIEKLENQYDTLLQKEWTGGTDLSGGQWQKIAIARTIFSDNGQAYCFDEPTSAIDVKSERKIFRWLLEENQKMVVYIVHKLEITSLADEILVMQNGKLVEHGSYNELIEKHGLFYDLYLMEKN
nr:ABC transporter ATP-binding protein [uncultured Lachnoclostridium sp.]